MKLSEIARNGPSLTLYGSFEFFSPVIFSLVWVKITARSRLSFSAGRLVLSRLLAKTFQNKRNSERYYFTGDLRLSKIKNNKKNASPTFACDSCPCAFIQLICLVVGLLCRPHYTHSGEGHQTLNMCALSRLVRPHVNWDKRTIHLSTHCCQREAKWNTGSVRATSSCTSTWN